MTPRIHTLPPYTSPFTGYDLSSDENQASIEALAEKARELICRPEFRTIVYAKFNPDNICVCIRRDRGRGQSPRLEGLSVIAHFDDFKYLGAEEVVRRASIYLATAEVQPFPEGCAAPYVNFDELPTGGE